MLIVDTSVALKWTVAEQGSDEALELISQPLLAPDLLQAELGSALTKKVRRNEISPDHARAAFDETIALVTLLSQPVVRGRGA